jgi:hypothetical protein
MPRRRKRKNRRRKRRKRRTVHPMGAQIPWPMRI